MRVEFNDNAYTIGNRIGRAACTGCVIDKRLGFQCPLDSKRECILPLDKIYTNLCTNQVFKL